MKPNHSSARKQGFLRSKKVWLVVIILLLAGSGATWYFFVRTSVASADTTTKTGTETFTATVRRGDIRVSASGSGTLVTSQSMNLSFSTSGTVAELNVKVGDQVTKGEVLARLGSADDLEANIASLQLQLLEAQKTLTDLQQNANVTLAQAYQDWVTAQATYNDAVTAAQRTALARCSQAVNTKYKAALDRAKEKLAKINPADYGSEAWLDAQNDYDTALANYNYCIGYTTTEKTDAQATLEVAKTAMDQAEQKYNTLKVASGIDPTELAVAEAAVKQVKIQLDQAQKDLEGITLTAPIDGKVTYLAANKGEIVDTSKYLTIVDVNHLNVDISVDETDMDKLVVGSPVTVVFDALPDQTFSGKVTQVDPEMTSSGQYRVATGVVELNGDAVKALQKVPLGLNATVTIINKESKNALLVPVTALKNLGDQGYAVMVVGSDGQLKLKTVQVGIKDTANVEILSGLKEGDLVSTGTAQTKASSSTSTGNSSGGVPGGFQPPDGGMPPVP